MSTFRKNLWRHAVAWVLILFTFFPLYVVVVSSLDITGSLTTNSLFPVKMGFENFTMLFVTAEGETPIPFMTWVKNSLFLATASSVLSVFIGAASAYAFSRLRFKGRKVGIQTLLLIQVFPSFLALAAIYVIMSEIYKVFPAFGLGSPGGLLLIYLGGAMGINAWLLKGFIDSIPAELDESARIDGATPSQVYWLIFFPLAAPVLAVVALLSFIGTFNEFVLASLFFTEPETRTVAVGLQQFVGGQFTQNWGPFTAGSIIASIPLVTIFLSLQKYIVGGLTAGSVKG
jgi:arabinogalactan oligomer/maltooligosaccharide transport system permease protein